MPGSGLNGPKPLNTQFPRRQRNPQTPQQPAYQPVSPPQNFLPQNADFLANQKALSDALSASQMGYQTQIEQLRPQADLQLARLGTDQNVAAQSLNENAAARGIYGSGVQDQLYNRDIATPYGRQRQDISSNLAAALSQLYSGMDQSNLQYQQGLADSYLQLAQQQAQALPLSLYQGGPPAPKPPRRTPKKPPKGKGKK